HAHLLERGERIALAVLVLKSERLPRDGGRGRAAVREAEVQRDELLVLALLGGLGADREAHELPFLHVGERAELVIELAGLLSAPRASADDAGRGQRGDREEDGQDEPQSCSHENLLVSHHKGGGAASRTDATSCCGMLSAAGGRPVPPRTTAPGGCPCR